MRARTLIAIGSFVAVLFLATRAHAQVLYGSLTGNVSDTSGAAVPNAKIETLDPATGISRQTTVDENGVYSFNDLQPGTYKVTISAPALGTVIEQGVVIAANAVRRVDVKLQPAQLNQSIVVDASVAVLQTDRADVSNQIDSAQIAQLPEPATRNYQSLLILVPGYSPPASSHSEAGNPQGALATNVNGASYNNNNTRLEGASDLYPWLPEIAAYIPVLRSHPDRQRGLRQLRR